jgi:CheY-like chemotaxis protein
MGDPRSAALFAALRAGLNLESMRHLVAVGAESEGQRIVAGLIGEGDVERAHSAATALAWHASADAGAPHDLLFTDLPELTAGDLARFAPTEVMPLLPADIASCTSAFFAGAAAVLPLPLPESEALLRAHLCWLAAGRRSRQRALAWPRLAEEHGRAIEELVPALGLALHELDFGYEPAPARAGRATALMVLDDDALAAALAAQGLPLAAVTAAPDVVVTRIPPEQTMEQRLREVRSKAAGAALVVLDDAATAARLSAGLYGGARAILAQDRALGSLPELARLLTTIGARRRAEVTGRRLIETLARFGVFGGSRGEAPAAPAQDVDARLISEVAASSASFVPSGHEVLVVDDEPVVVTVLREALRRGGYRVTTAASAEEAIDLFGRQSFDLVLTDKNLPGKSGLEVLRVARGLHPPPAVVLITGYSSYDSAVEAFEVGALDYIEKPIKDLESLRQRVRRALSRRDEQMAREPARDPSNPTNPPAAHVLLVEAEGERRQLMAEYLGRSYVVTTVPDGDRALSRLHAERFDVVLADRNLPGLSGLRVIEQARRLLPHCAAVLYTAYPSYETVKEAFELGVDAFCVRPSEDLKALGEKVAGALRGRGGILLG